MKTPEMNISEIRQSITDKTLASLAHVNAGDMSNEKAFRATIKNATVKAIYPVIEENKLNIRYDYFFDLVLFTSLGIVSLLFAFLLKAEDRKKGYGLELPNIEK